MSNLSSATLADLHSSVTTVAEKAIKLLCPEKAGGYFCVADDISGQPILVARIGKPPADKAEQYLAFCQEKARRLAQRPHHNSSWQSRDESKEQWGGAIRAGEYILSFSGFPELVDEAVMLTAAILSNAPREWGFLGVDAQVIARTSHNGHFAQLLDAVSSPSVL